VNPFREHHDAAILKLFLEDRDQPCPQCGYNLRDLAGNKCPECGEEIVLRLHFAEPKQAAALAGLIALAAGVGFNVLLLLFLIAVRDPLRPEIFPPLALGAVVFLGATALWLKMWRPIRRLGAVRRWVLVCVCVLFVLSDLIAFAKLIG